MLIQKGNDKTRIMNDSPNTRIPLCSGLAASVSKWLKSMPLLLSAAGPSFEERFLLAWQATRRRKGDGDGTCPHGCCRGAADPGGKEDLLLLNECLIEYGMRLAELAWGLV